MSKKMLVLIILASLTLLTASLLLMDYHITASRSQANTQTITVSANPEVFFPQNGLQGIPETQMALSGDQKITRYLEKTLPGRLQSETGGLLQDVRLVEAIPSPPDGNPAMLIAVTVEEYFWTPVYGKSKVTVQLNLATDGSVSVKNLEMNENTAGAIKMEQTISLDYQFSGLASLRGFNKEIAKAIESELAKQVASSLQSEMQRAKTAP